MSSYWEKLVDLYVDGECSNGERDAVEARAKVDSNVCRAIKEAEELRALLRSIPNKPPKEFETRLRDAIMNSPAWETKREGREIYVSRTGRFWTNASRRVASPVGIGTVAAFAIGVAVVFACFTLTKNESDDSGVPLAQAEQTLEKTESAVPTAEPWKLIPSPEGNAPTSNSKADSQENYWAIVRVDDKAQIKKHRQNLQTRCAELNVSYSKFGQNEQYRLQDVSKEQWRQIVEVWNGIDCERSEALARWSESSQEKQTIRVSFELESM